MNKRLLIAGGITSALALSAVAVFGLKEGNFPTYAAKVDSLDEEGLYSVVFNDFSSPQLYDTNKYLFFCESGRGSKITIGAAIEKGTPITTALTLKPSKFAYSYGIEVQAGKRVYPIDHPRAINVVFESSINESENEDDLLLWLSWGANKEDVDDWYDMITIESGITYLLEDGEDGESITWFDLYNASDTANFTISSIQVWYPTTVC